MNRPNPVSLEVLGELNFAGFEDKFASLAERISRDDSARAEWIEKVLKIEKQLRGKEDRKHKPWEHASELSIPLTKKLLRRWLPVMYGLVAHADPICWFKATIAGAVSVVDAVEDFFTWMTLDYMDGTLSEIQLLLHNIGAKGLGYLGVSWDYATEIESRVIMVDNIFPQGLPPTIDAVVQALQAQYEIAQPTDDLLAAAQKILQGAKFVRITYRTCIKDKPKIVSHDPLYVIVPPESGPSHLAEYVCLVHEFTASELRQLAQDGILESAAIQRLVADRQAHPVVKDHDNRQPMHSMNSDNVRRTLQNEAGVSADQDSKPFRVHQVYCRLDYNGDGIDERCILWYAPGSDNVRLACHVFPFSFRKWPIFRFDYEQVDRRPYLAQGMGEQLSDIQSQYTKQYRATSDAIDVQLAPVFQMRMGSQLSPRSIKWGPGKIIPVTEVGDIMPVEKSPFNLHQYLQDRGELKMFAEEMVGSIDAALASTGRHLERRTAFEVQSVGGQIEAMQGMDAAIFQQIMQHVWQCVWELWLDLGPDQIYYQVVGEQMPRLFRKSEYNYKFQLTPAGTPGNTNRQAELQRYLMAADFFMKYMPDIMNRPFIAERIAKLIDRRTAGQLILPQAQQQTQMLLAQAANQIAKGGVLDIMPGQGAGGGPAA